MDVINLETNTDMLSFLFDYFNLAGKEVTQKYKLDYPARSIVRKLPQFYVDTLCRHCGERMFTTLSGKSSASYKSISSFKEINDIFLKGTPLCSCGHKEYSSASYYSCKCPLCLEEQKRKTEQQMEKRRNKLNAIKFRIQSVEHHASLLPLKRDLRMLDYIKLYTLSYSFGGLEKTDRGYILPPFSCATDKIAPEGYDVTELIEPFNVYLSSKTEPSKLVGIDDGELQFSECYYNLPVPELADIHELILREGDQQIVDDFLKKLKKMEIYEYFYKEMDIINSSFSKGDKTELVINKLVNEHTLGAIYYFIHFAAKNALHDYHSGKLNSKRHAGNKMVNIIESISNRYKDEKWTREYNRPRGCEISVLRKVLDYLLSYCKDKNNYCEPDDPDYYDPYEIHERDLENNAPYEDYDTYDDLKAS